MKCYNMQVRRKNIEMSVYWLTNYISDKNPTDKATPTITTPGLTLEDGVGISWI